VVHVPVLGLIPEMAQSYHERTRMAAWREALGNIGDLVGLLLPFALRWMLAGSDGADADAAVSREAYGFTGAIGGSLAAVALLVTYAGTYEDPTFRRASAIGFRAGLAALRRNSAFRVLSVASALAALALAFTSALFLYVLEYVAGVSDPIAQGGLFVANIAGALASYPFWVAIARRRGKATAFRLGLVLSSLAFACVFLLRPGAIAPLVAVMIFAGAANVGFWVTLYTLNADIAELDEVETGERREGLFAGFAALLRKCAFAVAAGTLGVGLDWIGYVPHAQQSPQTVLGIKLLFAVPTTALVLAAWLVFRRFPLTPERWAAVAIELEKRNQTSA
jgi:GPH family glycoside/pentoside/hexuronide:cation symporter